MREMRQRHEPTAAAIPGGNTIVGSAPALLLGGVGYDAKTLGESPAGLPEDLLDGVDLLLVAPGPRDGPREAFPGATRSTPETAKMPVLALFSAVTGEGLDDGSAATTTWPSRIGKLATRSRPPCGSPPTTARRRRRPYPSKVVVHRRQKLEGKDR